MPLRGHDKQAAGGEKALWARASSQRMLQPTTADLSHPTRLTPLGNSLTQPDGEPASTWMRTYQKELQLQMNASWNWTEYTGSVL